jgi:hypothetical protein
MDIEGKRIWQIGSGDTDRRYADLLIEWDVVSVGPGRFGTWTECQEAVKAAYSMRIVTMLNRFCEQIREGDVIVLKLGTTDVYAVGEAIGNFLWLDDFGDIDGWDLQFVRRVRWLWKYSGQPKVFPVYALKWGDTVQQLNSTPVIEWLQSLKVAAADYSRGLVSLPDSCRDGESLLITAIEEIGDYLFDKGIAFGSIEMLVNQMDDLVRIARWYQGSKEYTSESETVAYLVVPLLRALGWTPQKMAIEWNSVDAALFSRLPRGEKNLAVAVEVKRRNMACLTAKSQAESYAAKKGRESCGRLIVTDGLRYAVFIRGQGGSFPKNPQAYLNLTRPLGSYPILKCKGAKDALSIMAPDWSP